MLRTKRFGIFVSLKHMADSGPSRMVLFRMGPVLWGAPASIVREVITCGRPTRIPGTDRAVTGLVNLRGTLLTIVDGRRAAGIAESDTQPGAVLVVEQNGRSYGLGVDEVLDLVEVRPDDLSAGTAPPGMDARLVRAHGRHGGRMFTVLDMEALLAPVLG